MTKLLSPESVEAKVALSGLFEQAPVLVEVRFPRMGTAPDWYLCKEEEELEEILQRLGRGVELHLVSVWDLSLDRLKGEIRLRK